MPHFSNCDVFAVIFAAALSLTVTTASAEMMEVVNIDDGDTLNLRAGPGASFPDLGDLF